MKKTLLKTSVVQSASSNWDDEKVTGILKEALEAGDKLALSDKNIKGDTEHVVLLVTPKGSTTPEMILCSSGVSKNIRKAIENGATKKDVIKALLKLRMVTTLIGDDERTVIVNDGSAMESFDFVALAKGEVVALEDLIA